jgi:peptidoglycan-associated lipoprotein
MVARLTALAGALLFLAGCASAPPPPMASPAPAMTGAQYAPGSQQDLAANAGDRVFFTFDSAQISTEAQQILQRQAQWLQHYPNVSVTIEGHCDERGTREYNLALGERRANAAMNVLRAAGVPAARLATISYGKERPIVPGSTEDAYAQNRVAITVVK